MRAPVNFPSSFIPGRIVLIMIEKQDDMDGCGNEMIRSKCNLEGHENVVTYPFHCTVSRPGDAFFYQIVVV